MECWDSSPLCEGHRPPSQPGVAPIEESPGKLALAHAASRGVAGPTSRPKGKSGDKSPHSKAAAVCNIHPSRHRRQFPPTRVQSSAPSIRNLRLASAHKVVLHSISFTPASGARQFGRIKVNSPTLAKPAHGSPPTKTDRGLAAEISHPKA